MKELATLFLCGFLMNAIAQSTIYTDAFSSSCDIGSNGTMSCSSGNGYLAGAQPWRYTEFESSFGPSAAIGSGILTMSNTFGVNNNSGANMVYKQRQSLFAAGAGDYTQTSNAGFNTVLTSNDSLIIWTINFQTDDPIDMMTNGTNLSSTVGAAYVLAINTNMIESCTANIYGYAVVMGDGVQGQNNQAIRLCRFQNDPPGAGCATNQSGRYAFYNRDAGNIDARNSTICIASSDMVPQVDKWYSIKVIYNPFTEEWSLYVRFDGNTALDPNTLNSSHCVGTGIDATYTNNDMRYLGCYGAYGSNSGLMIRWDNMGLRQLPVAQHPGGCVGNPGCSCTLIAPDVDPVNDSDCPGGTGTFTYNPNAGGAVHQWQYSSDGVTWTNVTNGTPATAVYSGANTATLTVTGITAAGPHYFRDLADIGGCQRVSDAAQFILNSVGTTTVDQTTQNVAPCDVPDLITLTQAPGNATQYQWYSQAGNAGCPSGANTAGWTLEATQSSTTTAYAYNFDSGVNGWTLAGNFAIGVPSGGTGTTVTTGFSGTSVLATVLNGNYTANMTEAANYAISPLVNLNGVSNVVLSFRSRSWFRQTGLCFPCSTADRGKVYLSVDNGTTWTLLEDNSWNEGSWTLHSINLPAAANQAQVRIRFTMLSNSDANNYNGWNIDDVQITGNIAPSFMPSDTDPEMTYALLVSDANGCTSWANNCQLVTIPPCALAVQVKAYDVVCTDDGVSLTWTTEYEENNAYFTIERSEDGIHFEELTRVQGKISSQEETEYIWVDHAPPGGKLYYTLAQTDLNGSVNVLDTRMVNCASFGDFTLFPNPNSGSFSVLLPDGKDALPAEIIDLYGKLHWRGIVNNEEVLDTQLSEGTYLLRFYDRERLVVRRFTIR
jgi:hypothetical protein